MVVERTLMFFGSMITCSALIFAVCSKFWAEFYLHNQKYNAGLWSVCPDTENECLSYDEWMTEEDIPSWLYHVRILIASACTLSGITVMLSLVAVVNPKMKNVYVSVIHFLTSAVIAGVCVVFNDSKHFYNHKQLYQVEHLWAFYLSIATSAWSFFLAAFGIMADHCNCLSRTSDHDYGIQSDNV